MTGNDRPVHIRRNIDNWGDPYIQSEDPEEILICTRCQAIYHDRRWYLKEQVSPEVLRREKPTPTLCPACQKLRDHVPGGVVQLSGSFLENHKEEILNLIHNESARAMTINPLERIMEIRPVDAKLEILTTNEKLAQRIGRALHKAYHGTVKYKWSEDTKLARVSWERD